MVRRYQHVRYQHVSGVGSFVSFVAACNAYIERVYQNMSILVITFNKP